MILEKMLKKVVAGETLTLEESEKTFQAIMNGAADNQGQIGSLLTALKLRGETAEEIAGAAKVLRTKAAPFNAPAGTIDLCGTGGDGLNTLNISTAASFVVAACGVPVAKHGNRAISSASGSADVLEALGIKIDLPAEAMETCLQETNFAFLFAPQYHPVMRRVMDVRKQLGFRTIFNLVGPLANPARVKGQLIGVPSAALVPVFAKVAEYLGIERAMIVHGEDGMDEISVTAKTLALLNGKEINISPDAYYNLEEIEGGDATYNATAIRHLFLGKGSDAFREAVRVNASAALVVAGKYSYEDFALAYAEALDAIQTKKAYDTLTRVIEITNANEHA
jgi:anthranilate phosphoribosyltransferase